MRLFDSHCHMDDDAYEEDRQECLKRAEDAGLTGILNPGYDIASSLAAIDLSAKSDLVWAAIGIHPQKGEEHNPASYDEIAKLAGKFKVVAIGEIGLDFFLLNRRSYGLPSFARFFIRRFGAGGLRCAYVGGGR